MTWFTNWLQRFVQLGLDLVAQLVRGLLGSPATAAARAVSDVTVRQGDAREVLDVRHEVLRKGRPRDTAVFSGDDDPSTRHWVAVQADRVVGVVSVMAADAPDWVEGAAPAWQLRGMAVHPGWQGRGVGRTLLDVVQREVGEPLWCNARDSAAGFYARAGWTEQGEGFVIEGIGPHHWMITAR